MWCTYVWNIQYANQAINATIEVYHGNLKEKLKVQIGSPEIIVVDPSISLQCGHSLLVCGHVQTRKVLLQSM
jgi:hypothetical protein